MRHALWVLLIVAACGGVSPQPDPVPTVVDAAEQCAAICARLTHMRCEGWQGNAGPDEAAGTADDVTCEHACVEVQAMVALPAGCILTATSCAAVESCEAP